MIAPTTPAHCIRMFGVSTVLLQLSASFRRSRSRVVGLTSGFLLVFCLFAYMPVSEMPALPQAQYNDARGHARQQHT